MSVLSLSRLSGTEMGQQIERLCAAFGRPFKANAKAMTDEWHRSLGPRFHRDVIVAAVDRCMDLDRKFPTLARLRDLCFKIEGERAPKKQKSLRQEFHEWDLWAEGATADQSTPCPVCRARATWTARGLLMVHDDLHHADAHISYSNWGKPEWVDMGPMTEPAPPKRRRAQEELGGTVAKVLEQLPAPKVGRRPRPSASSPVSSPAFDPDWEPGEPPPDEFFL